MTKIVVVNVRGRMAHFGTAFSNHTSKMSNRVPSKSALHGMFGAAMGFGMEELKRVSNRYSFKWLSEVRTDMIAKSRYVLNCKTDVKSVLGLKEWERGELGRSVDYIEHVRDAVGGVLRARWVIEVDSSLDVDRVVASLWNPEYPLYFGKSECLAVVESVEVVDADLERGTGTFTDYFVGDFAGDRWVITERMVSEMTTYRKPAGFADVYTLSSEVEGTPTDGYYTIEGVNYCMW